MNMAWTWQQHLRHISARRHLGFRWLALLEKDHSVAGQETDQVGDHAANDISATAFEAFFLRYDRQITGYLWRMTGDEQIASELAQETFLRAWKHFAEVSHYEQPLAWLFRVATNLARQHHRRQAIPGRRVALFDEESDSVGSDPTMHIAEQDLVRQTLLQLPLHQRSALILREVYGLSCAEVGSLLNISRDAVKMTLWRAREQFRKRYLREDEEA